MAEVINSANDAACAGDAGTRVTKSLLGYGAVAGPFYVLVVLGQALVRPGFNLLRHDVSLLSNGSLGWIQVANFLLTGAMVIAAAVGMARALDGRGATWAPRLLALFGLGMIGAGIFVADPMNGFPAGAPAGRPDSISVHGLLHLVCAGIGFLCLIAACLLMAVRFLGRGERGWGIYSVVTGAGFLVAFGAVASGSGSPFVVAGFWAALILVWSWIGTVSIRLYRTVRER